MSDRDVFRSFGAVLASGNGRPKNGQRLGCRTGSTIYESSPGDANLAGANLREANLEGADLWDATLAGADLRDADLGRRSRGQLAPPHPMKRGSWHDDAPCQRHHPKEGTPTMKAEVPGMNLPEADPGAKLRKTDLSRAEVRGADDG